MTSDDTFGGLLRRYRSRTTDPLTNRPLSQERLAELMHVSTATISNWERNEKRPRADERLTLLRLVGVLAEHGGLRSVAQADALLHAGDYRALNEEEQQEWLPGLPPGEGQEPGRTPRRPSLLASAWSSLKPQVGEDESALAAVVMHFIGRRPDRFTAEDALRLIGILHLWFGAALAWLELLRWPYPDSASALRACLIWGGASALLPLLLGLITQADRQAYLLERTGARRSVVILRTTGALAGYQIGAFGLWIIALLLYYLALWPLPRWLIVALAGFPLLLSYAGARQTPHNYFRAFSQSRGKEAALRIEESDIVVALAFLGFGPGLAAFFYFSRSWLLQPALGLLLLGLALGLTAALQAFFNRRGQGVIPAEAFALLLGIPLGLQLLVTPGSGPLAGEGLLAILMMIALLLNRRRIEPRPLGLLGLLLALLLLWGLAEVGVDNRLLGAVISISLLAWWLWKPHLWRRLLRFWLLLLALVTALLLIKWALLPLAAVRAGFVLVALVLLLWEARQPRKGFQP